MWHNPGAQLGSRPPPSSTPRAPPPLPERRYVAPTSVPNETAISRQSHPPMNPNNPRNLPPPSIEECPQYPAPPYGQMSGTVYTSFTGKSYVPHENHLVKTRDLVEAILEGAYKPQETLEVEEGFVHPYFEYLRDAWIPLENSGEDLPGTFRKFDEKLGEAWDKDTAFWKSSQNLDAQRQRMCQIAASLNPNIRRTHEFWHMGRTNLFEAGRHLGYTEYIKLTKLALYEAYNQIYYDVLAERVTERASAAAPKKSGMWGWIA